MDTQRLLRKLRQAYQRPQLLVDYIREPRQQVVDSLVGNRLGLQLARIAKDTIAFHARPPRVTERIRQYHEVMERDGIVVIPDFFSADEFALIQQEWKLAESDDQRGKWKRFVWGKNFFSDQLLVTYFPTTFPNMVRLLADNPIIGELASAVSRRKMTYRPHFMIQKIVKDDWAVEHIDLDYTLFPHSDRHYPFIKAFVYLEDCDESSGPYGYARGSHKMNAARLAYEYKFSVTYSSITDRGRPEDRTEEQLMKDIPFRSLPEKFLKEQGFHIEPIVGKANTLIVSNNQGFHCRCPLKGSKRRAMAVIDYKYLESVAHHLYPVLKHVKRGEDIR